MPSVLVLGGAGYLGAHLVPLLLSEGHRVSVLDNFTYGQPSLAKYCSNPNFELALGDIRDSTLVSRMISKADIIVPLAAIVGAPACEKRRGDAFDINVSSIKMMLNFLHNTQLVLYPGTNSVYGVGAIGRPCTEDSMPNPLSDYAKQKLQAERILLEHPMTICTRFATLFGLSDRMRLDLLINDFVNRAIFQKEISIFEGTFKRNFLHVSDAALAMSFFIANPESHLGEIFNVGLSGVNLNKIELCELIRQHVPDFVYIENSLATDPDQRNYLVSNEKIEKVGFKAQTSVDDGIRELIKGLPMFQNAKYANV